MIQQQTMLLTPQVFADVTTLQVSDNPPTVYADFATLRLLDATSKVFATLRLLDAASKVLADVGTFGLRDVEAFEIPGTKLTESIPHLLSATESEAQQPTWLRRVERRIEDSVASEERRSEEPGRWLSESVAKAGLNFFRSSASLLPSEPFIYSSRDGRLVAEFKGEHGTLTTVVSTESTILFAANGEEFFEKTLDPAEDKGGTVLRGELRKIVQMLGAGRNAFVGSSG